MGASPSLNVLLGGPTTDYGDRQPLRRIPSARTRAARSFNGSVATYTFTKRDPADAKGSWAVAIEARRTITFNPAAKAGSATYTEGAVNPIAYIAVTDGTPVRAPQRRHPRQLQQVPRPARDDFLARRPAHRDRRVRHVPQPERVRRERRRPPRLPSDPSPKRLIHRIHSGENLTQDFTVYGFSGMPRNFNEVRYPGDRKNCLQCHTSTSTYDLPLPNGAIAVITLARLLLSAGPGHSRCLGCHDNVDAAAHAYLNTVSFPFAEACATCHGDGKDWDVVKVHALRGFFCPGRPRVWPPPRLSDEEKGEAMSMKPRVLGGIAPWSSPGSRRHGSRAAADACEDRARQGATAEAPVCADCHDQAKTFAGNPHTRIAGVGWSKPGAENAACNSCHGPGDKHMESSGEDKSDLRPLPGEGSRVLHDLPHGDPAHASFQTGIHANTETVNCLSCHSVHTPERRPLTSDEEALGPLRQLPPVADGVVQGQALHAPDHAWRWSAPPATTRMGAGGQGPQVDARGRAAVPELPLREARAVRLRARQRDRRQLHELPRAPRLLQQERLIRATVANLCLECHSTLSTKTLGRSRVLPQRLAASLPELHYLSRRGARVVPVAAAVEVGAADENDNPFSPLALLSSHRGDDGGSGDSPGVHRRLPVRQCRREQR